VAALIREKTGSNADVVEGKRGEFTVWVGDTRVAEKSADGFPSDHEVLSAVQQALARGE
jgi:hypothetical protein